MPQGIRTAQLAKRIAELLNQRGVADGLKVICSHRGDCHDALRDAGVDIRSLVMFLGEAHSRATRIGIGDIALVTRERQCRAILLIEIEESRDGISAKDVLCDALMPLLAHRVEVQDERGRVQRVNLVGSENWVAFHPRKGDDRASSWSSVLA